MTADEIRSRINEMCSHFTFEYNGKDCGVDPLSRTRFDMWYGDIQYTAKNIDEVMNTSIFEGKSLSEIPNDIKVDCF